MTKEVKIPGTDMATRLELLPVELKAPKRKFDVPTVEANAAFAEMGVEVETISPLFPPTAKWKNVGDSSIGLYEGMEEHVGPNDSNLYYFSFKEFGFGVWGTTMIDRIMAPAKSVIEKGNLVQITFIGEISTDQNPCKMFEFKVGKKPAK